MTIYSFIFKEYHITDTFCNVSCFSFICLYLHLYDMKLKLRWSNTMILNNQQYSYVFLNLLINISNSYLNNKLPFI